MVFDEVFDQGGEAVKHFENVCKARPIRLCQVHRKGWPPFSNRCLCTYGVLERMVSDPYLEPQLRPVRRANSPGRTNKRQAFLLERLLLEFFGLGDILPSLATLSTGGWGQGR